MTEADEYERPATNWDIRRAGRRWSGAEFDGRCSLAPEKVEFISGKMFWNEAERLTVLAMLLENVGLDEAVKLASPAAWREAIAQLPD